MESMGKKKPRPRRSFTPEFKAEIVELCRRGDRSVGQVAKDFDLTETAVRLWISQAEVDAGERDGLTSNEREELAAPRRENRRLREDVEILKRATLDSTGQRYTLGWGAEEGWTIEPEDLAHISAYLAEHINRFGEYATHKLGIQPDAYDPKLDVDFTHLRGFEPAAERLSQAA